MSGLFGGTGVSNDDTSTSNSSTTTNQQDNRVVAGDGAVVVGQDGQYTQDNSFGLYSSSSNSTNTTNSGNWDWYANTTSQDDNSLNVTTSTDSSNSGNWDWNTSNTTNTTNSGGNWDWNTSNDSHDTYTLSDSGAMATAQAISATNAEFLGLAAETQGDTLQFIAQMSADQLAATGDSMTEMFTYGADQNRQAWESTLAASQGLIGQMLGQAAATTASAKEIAQSAISSFMPTDNKNSDTMRWAVIGALAFLAWRALK